jgi:anti-sigma B factor antagonist
MTVQMTHRRGVPVAQVCGEVDAVSATTLAHELFAGVPNTAPGLVLDLTETTVLDSVGVRVLFETVERLGRRGQRLRVVITADSVVEDIARLCDLESYAALDLEVASAVAQLSGARR